MNNIWVLVANGSEARLLSMDKARKQLELVEEFLHPASRMKDEQLASDRPRRTEGGREGDAGSHGAYEERTDPKEYEFERFARELADRLDRGRTANAFEALVIVAPPHFHGRLNRHLSEPTRRLVSHHVEKDYTDVRQGDLLDRLAPHLA